MAYVWDKTVTAAGGGDYTTISAAITAAPDLSAEAVGYGNRARITITDSAIYSEQLDFSAKPNLTLTSTAATVSARPVIDGASQALSGVLSEDGVLIDNVEISDWGVFAAATTSFINKVYRVTRSTVTDCAGGIASLNGTAGWRGGVDRVLMALTGSGYGVAAAVGSGYIDVTNNLITRTVDGTCIYSAVSGVNAYNNTVVGLGGSYGIYSAGTTENNIAIGCLIGYRGGTRQYNTAYDCGTDFYLPAAQTNEVVRDPDLDPTTYKPLPTSLEIGSGVSGTGVLFDLDGSARAATPTRGAYELILCPAKSKMVVDSATFEMSAALWKNAPEHKRSVPRQLYRGPGGAIKTNALLASPYQTGTLTLRLTGAERAEFHTSYSEDIANGETMRVYADADSATYVDCVLEPSVWTEVYKPMFFGRDDWYTVDIPVAFAAGDSF